MLSKASAAPEGVALSPGRLPDDAVKLAALAPSVAAGLLIFRIPAGEALAVAIGVGILAHLAAWAARWPAGAPVVAAVVAVALVGAGCPLNLAAVAAGAAACLEILRARLVPAAGLQAGLLVYVILLLATRGAVATYLNPFGGGVHPEPIRLWHTFYPASAAPIDPVRLYVGNLPDPMFTSSLLAVVIGIAYLWYARRLSPMLLVGFALGAFLPIWSGGWSLAFHLDSGPAWFAAGLLLADRRALPGGRLSRPLVGLAAGLGGFGARNLGFGIEAVFVAAASVQVVVALVQAGIWLLQNKHDLAAAFRQREGSHHFGPHPGELDEPSPV